MINSGEMYGGEGQDFSCRGVRSGQIWCMCVFIQKYFKHTENSEYITEGNTYALVTKLHHILTFGHFASQ